MTPGKIKEGFEAWLEKDLVDRKFFKNLNNYTRDSYMAEVGWQACAEWMLSQGEKEFDLAICSEWQGTLTEYELSQVKNVWMIARLSSAKEIASLKDQILRYEQDNRELRAKSLNEIAEKDELITKTRSEREAQYRLGCDTQAELNKTNEELFFARERTKALEGELLILFNDRFSENWSARLSTHFPLAKELASKKEST